MQKERGEKIIIRKYLFWFLGSGFFLFLDQISKILIRKEFRLGESREIWSHFLRFTYVENHHAIFGLNLPIEYFFYPAAIISMGFILYYIYQIKDYRVVFLLSLISGGAYGNVIDRLLYGSVTDFIDMGLNSNLRWYIYNVADAFIFVGIIALLIVDFMKKHSTKNEPAG